MSTLRNKEQEIQLLIEYNNFLHDGIVRCIMHFYNQLPINNFCDKNIVNNDYSINTPVHNFDMNVYPTKQKTGTIQADKTELTDPRPWYWEIKNNTNVSHKISTKHLYFNYCGADIYLLLILKGDMFNTMTYLLKDKANISENLSLSIFVIDIQKIKKQFYAQNRKSIYRIKQSLCSGKLKRKKRLNHDEAYLLSRNSTVNAFEVITQQQCMSLRISMGKYSIPKLVTKLTKGGKLNRKSSPISKCLGVSSICIGNWYFQNVSQGYLLRIILCNVKVNTINVMRNLYFLLVIDKNTNVNVQINFMLKHALITEFDDILSSAFSSESLKWDEHHRNVLKSSAIASFYFTNIWNGHHSLRSPRAITFNIKSLSNAAPNQTVDKDSQTENKFTGLGKVLSKGTVVDKSEISRNAPVDDLALQTDLIELHSTNSQQSSTILTWSTSDIPLTQRIMWLIEFEKSTAHIKWCEMFNTDNIINESLFEASCFDGKPCIIELISEATNFCVKFGKSLLTVFSRK